MTQTTQTTQMQVSGGRRYSRLDRLVSTLDEALRLSTGSARRAAEPGKHRQPNWTKMNVATLPA